MENFKIIFEKENPLYNRKEAEFNIDAKVTPSREDVKKFISEKFSSPPEAIKIKGIYGGFGSKTFTIKVNIYKSGEDKDNIEPKSKRDQKPVQPAEPEAEPVAETPVETPEKQAEPQELQSVETTPAPVEPVQREEKKEEVSE